MGRRGSSTRGRVSTVVAFILGLSIGVAACSKSTPDEGHAESDSSVRSIPPAKSTMVASDIDNESAVIGPDDDRCLDEGFLEVALAHPELEELDEPDDLTQAQHDEMVAVLAEVISECLDIGAVKQATMELGTQRFDVGPEVAPCWVEAMDDAWYVRLMADMSVHGGESDDTYFGQHQAVILRCQRSAFDDQYRDAGMPEAFIQCQTAAYDALVADLERNPERWRELTGEPAGNERAASCLGTLPALSRAGEIDFVASPEGFGDAVGEELFAQTSSEQSACMAAALIDGIGDVKLARANPTAVEVVDYLRGGHSAVDLGFELSNVQAEAIADGLLDCVGTEFSRMSHLARGNILDGLGRPEEPPDLGELTECAISSLDAATLRDFLVRQFIDGPAAHISPAGIALVEHSFAVVADCADQLGIPHSPPMN
jgi:hypothetical protein